MRSPGVRRWVLLAVFIAVFIWLISDMSLAQAALRALFPGESQVLYPGAPLVVLVGQHIRLVAISSTLTVLVGVPLGIWVTRPSGRDHLAIVSAVTSFAQTFPPVAVLALAVPMLGFGARPTVFALFLYGLLPVVRNTIAGLGAVPESAVDAALGMGMGPARMFFRVELPLAARVIMAGVRISVIINVGTAMVGSVIGAGGLGSPIIAGLVENNTAFIVEGAIPGAILAILLDQTLASVERLFTYPGQQV